MLSTNYGEMSAESNSDLRMRVACIKLNRRNGSKKDFRYFVERSQDSLRHALFPIKRRHYLSYGPLDMVFWTSQLEDKLNAFEQSLKQYALSSKQKKT